MGLERLRRQELNSFGGCGGVEAHSQWKLGFKDLTTYMDRER